MLPRNKRAALNEVETVYCIDSCIHKFTHLQDLYLFWLPGLLVSRKKLKYPNLTLDKSFQKNDFGEVISAYSESVL